MNKSVIVNCKNFKCKFNNSGDCKLSHVSLASDGNLIVSKLICEDAEPIPEKNQIHPIQAISEATTSILSDFMA